MQRKMLNAKAFRAHRGLRIMLPDGISATSVACDLLYYSMNLLISLSLWLKYRLHGDKG